MERDENKTSLPIRAKLSLLFTLLLAALALFFITYIPSRLEDQALEALADKARSIAAMTAFGVGPTLYFNDPGAGAPALESARQSHDVDYLVVETGGGKVASSWGLERAQRRRYKEADDREGLDAEGAVYRVSAPVEYGGREVGRLYLGMSLEKLRAETARSRQAVALTTAGVFILGVLAVLLLSRLLTRPLLQMVATVRGIEAGDLTRRAPVAGRDEVGLLARSFNAMLESLAAVSREREQLNHELERRVEERTTALAESEARYALAARGTNDGLWDWDLAQGSLYLSPRWRGMLGLDPEGEQRGPEEWLGRVHPDDRRGIELDLAAHWEGRSPQFEREYRIRHADGGYRWMLARGLALRRPGGGAYRMAGSQTDITDRKRAEERLLFDAVHDALTGLPNRVLLLDRLSQALARHRRHPGPSFAVLFLDLDRFKLVNDSLGHLAGDALLGSVGARLREALRPGDTVARLGGDEFAVLLEEVGGEEEAVQAAVRVLRALAEPFCVEDQSLTVTASAGIALAAADYERPEEILRDADTAMYRAKALGKARHCLFHAGMHVEAVETLSLETDLRHALDRGELEVFYQPIVDLPTGRIAAVESLARWRHPTRGLIPPDLFIPVAEETGIILALDHFVLERAAGQVQKWREHIPQAGALVLSSNLSPHHFAREGLLAAVDGALERTGLPPAALKLELTEGVLMEISASTRALLTSLRDRGIRLVVDDFGKGYSSLSYLHRLPLHTLKIDRAFVSGPEVDRGGWEIVRTIVSLAHNLGLETVAEGVETAEQAAGLRALGCEFAQGFLFAKPLEAGAMESMLRSQGAVT